MRLRLDCAYDGSGFHGWATQPQVRTVQADLEAALCTVLRVPSAEVTCAGRTDKGVHARGQVVHLDVEDAVLAAAAGRADERAVPALVRRLNGVLGEDVRVLRGAVAPPGFDARFGALWRRYSYRVADLPEAVDPLTRHHVLAWPRPLHVEAMDEAGSRLVGEHDFAPYCKRKDWGTTVRRLLELCWHRDAAGTLVATVRADAFCHHMVRGIVGALLAVGEGRRPTDWPREVLDAGVRDSAVRVAPAHGLTLEEVGYPPDGELAFRAATTRRVRTGG